jgi:hypothetical protein
MALPTSGTQWVVLSEEGPVLTVDLGAWGPQWSWLGLRGAVRDVEGTARLTASGELGAARLDLGLAVRARGPAQLEMVATAEASADAALTLAMAAITPDLALYRGGRAILTGVDGSTVERALPLPVGPLPAARRVEFVDREGGRRVAVVFSEPAALAADGNLRVVLAQNRMAAGARSRVGWTLELPQRAVFVPTAAALPAGERQEGWYRFEPHARSAGAGGADELSLAGWLDRPAGRLGRIVAEGDRLVYGGRPIKLWGLNLCYAACAPTPEVGARRAALYAKHRFNSVRQPTYADGPGWAGIQATDTFADFDPAGLERMDRFVAQLKEAGLFVKLSPVFMVKLGRGDRAAVPYLDEFGRLGERPDARVDTKHGSLYLSRELQDLLIRQMTRLLEHRNPHTGQRYADDPAIAVVEIFNEDSALFYGTMARLQEVPTLRARAGVAFTAWLRARYGTEAAWRAAWGERAISSFGGDGFPWPESWAEGSVLPVGNPWFFDPDQLAGSQAFRRQRLLDTMEFLYELQNDFYDRYVAAIRATGYTGEILASNWQAGRGFSHFYNLHSDARIGIVDRHNYFGGTRGGERLIDARSMLARAGSGSLSAGLQQVAGRPFMLSEWIHVYPNEWGVEGPALVGAYGMGLQGWDASYLFQNRDDGRFSERIGRDQWDAVAPQILGAMPAISRQVLRGDVTEAAQVVPRLVHLPSLREGRLGFVDAAEQDGDVKDFGGDEVPAATLAVARAVVEFVDRFRPTPRFEIEAHRRDGALVSSTGQLRWHESGAAVNPGGWVVIDTPATQGYVGFAPEATMRLGDVALRPRSRFAAVYVTAQERDRVLADARRWVVTAIARARNEDAVIVRDRLLLEAGRGPVVLEPVRFGLHVGRRGAPTVHVLDHAGHRTGRTLPVRDGIVEIDTGRDATPYYLIEW